MAARIHHELTHGREILRLHYQPAYDPLPKPTGQLGMKLTTEVDRSAISAEEIQSGFLARLAEVRSEEIARGMTVIGPHRDELRFLGNGIDLGEYGSRGQMRTTLLALKLAEVSWMKERTGEWPVTLLDEVMAELDLQRRARPAALRAGRRAGDADRHRCAACSRLISVKKAEVWNVAEGSVQR